MPALQELPRLLTFVDAGETLTRLGYWRRDILPPGIGRVFGESGGLVKPASGGKFGRTWGELSRKSLDQ